MRWYDPSVGDVKVVTKFLLLPLTIYRFSSRCRYRETRWLETATIKYVYTHGMDDFYWRPIEFLDKEEN